MVLWIHLCWLLTTLVLTGAEEQEINITPAEVKGALNKDVYVRCDATGKPLPTNLQWLAPSGRPVPSQIPNRIYQEFDAASNQLNLFITKIKADDSGTYRCIGSADGESIESSMIFTTYQDLEIVDAPTEQNPISGQDWTIKCKMVSDPKPIITWQKGSTSIASSGRFTITENGLHIRNVSEADNGLYRCRAGVAERAQLKNVEIKVDVYTTPRITDLPKDIRATEGLEAMFTCKASGVPPPAYNWYKNALMLDNDDKYIKEDGSLRILNLVKEDEGDYKCRVENRAGISEANAKLVVMIPPTVKQPDNKTAVEGESVDLVCEATGDPLPEMTWKKQDQEAFVLGTQPDDNRLTMSEQPGGEQYSKVLTLSVQNVQGKDKGQYTCEARNDAGNSYKYAVMSVTYYPIFTSNSSSEVNSWIEHTVNLTCHVDADPPAELEWRMNGQPVENSAMDAKVFGSGHLKLLEITTNVDSDFEMYECVASNDLGTRNRLVKVKQVYEPQMPPSAKPEIITPTTVTFEVSPPLDDGGLAPSSYEVRYKPQHELDWEQASVKSFPAEGPYILDELEPSSLYDVQITAVNEVGAGVPTGDIKIETEKESVPEIPKVKKQEIDLEPFGEVMLENIENSNRYMLYWELPLSDGGRDIKRYQITYEPVKYNNETNKFEKRNMRRVTISVQPPRVRHELTGLQSDSYYKVEIRAENELGFSEPDVHFIKTQPGQDFYPPEEVKRAGMSTGAIIGLIIIIIILVLIVIDLYCYMNNQCGVIMTVCVKFCGKEPGACKAKEVQMEEGKAGDTEVKVTVEGPKDEPIKADPVEEIKMDEKEPEDKEREETEETPMIQQQTEQTEQIQTPDKERCDEEDHK